ncbi:discoidin domain-containing protein, partial [Hyalangium minutum]|uniref:galactose-binding domain-containing protein n=1 Tax=Hyalangium minutum TaxID=394096 RepID=UPI0005C56DAD
MGAHAAPGNLAQGKPATQSSTNDDSVAALAVDGQTEGNLMKGSVTHTLDTNKPWWQVDLRSVQQVGMVVLHNRSDCCGERLSNFKLMVSENGSTWQEYPYPGTAPLQVQFPVNRAARYVKVQLNGQGVLSLAEVQVTALNNLAQGKPTSQSSTNDDSVAALAVDGQTEGNLMKGSVTHTLDTNKPWWQVDLQSVQQVGMVVLHNRSDCCGERLSNFKLMVSENG